MSKKICNAQALVKKLRVWLKPGSNKKTMHCVDSSDKNEVGQSFEFADEYNVCLENASRYDIFAIEGIPDWLREKQTGRISLPAQKMLIVNSLRYWELDWSNDYSLRLWLDERRHIDIGFRVPKDGQWGRIEGSYGVKLLDN